MQINAELRLFKTFLLFFLVMPLVKDAPWSFVRKYSQFVRRYSTHQRPDELQVINVFSNSGYSSILGVDQKSTSERRYFVCSFSTRCFCFGFGSDCCTQAVMQALFDWRHGKSHG